MIKYLMIIMLFGRLVYAQGEAAVPFLRIAPSPNLNGMAGAFTAMPSDDPYGHYFNPAQLGYFSRSSKLAYGFYPVKTNWLPTFNFSDLNFSSSTLSAGIDLSAFFPVVKLSLGIGYINTKLNLGENVWTSETGEVLGRFRSYEKYDAWAFGLGVEYYVQFNIGYGVKRFKSVLGPVRIGSESPSSAEGDAGDFGMLLNIPVQDIYNKVSGKTLMLPDDIEPHFDFSLGYAVMNSGDRVRYIDAVQSDPLPKLAKIGYGLSIGLSGKVDDTRFTFITLDWSSEARDILIERSNGGRKYSNSPGKINFLDHVLNGKSNAHIYIFQGWRIGLLESFRFSYGRFKGPGWHRWQRTFGYGFSTSGLFKWLGVHSNQDILSTLINHLEINYAFTRYNSFDPLNMTEFEGVNISIKNISF